MADFSDIPDEAWIDVVAAVGWDESNELWPVLQTALAAALPVLNTARDASPDVQPHDEYRRLWMHRFDTLLSNADVLDEDDQLAVLNVHEALLAEQYHNHRAALASRDSETAELRAENERLRTGQREAIAAELESIAADDTGWAIAGHLRRRAASLRGEQ